MPSGKVGPLPSSELHGSPADDVGAEVEWENHGRADVLRDQDRHGTPLGQTLDDREKHDLRDHIEDSVSGQILGGAGRTDNKMGEATVAVGGDREDRWRVSINR